jgi:ribulose-phosphate 3-epimerase
MKKTHCMIAPSILSADFACLGEQIAQAESAGADWVHVDVMDGHFVPNLTMGPFIVEHVRRITSLPIDVHLMVESPEEFIVAFANAGASHLTVHVETCPDPVSTLKKIQSLGCKAGITLSPATPAGDLAPALPLADLVLIMTVHPGYSGQAFIPEMSLKVTAVRRMLDELGSSAWLEVDGGITTANITQLQGAGADAFVAAHAVFKNPDGIVAGIHSLRTGLRTGI